MVLPPTLEQQFNPLGSGRNSRSTIGYVTIPAGWDNGWQNAIKTAQSGGTATVTFNTDSIGGFNVTDNAVVRAHAFPDLVRNMILNKYGLPVQGDGFSWYEYTYCTDGTTSGSLADVNNPFGQIAAASAQIDNAMFGYAVEDKLTSAGVFQTVNTAGCSGFDLIVGSVSNVATFTVTGLPADAVVTGTGTSFNSGTGTLTYTNHGTNSFISTPVDKISVRFPNGDAPASININNPSATHGLILGGLCLYQNPGGLFVYRNVHSGNLSVEQTFDSCTTGAPDYKGRTSFPTYKAMLWTNGVDGINGNPGASPCWLSSTPFGPPSYSDLFIDEHIINDCSISVPRQNFRFSKKSKWEAVRRANPNAAIMAVLPSFPSFISDEVAGGSGFYQDFKEDVYGLAASFGAIVIDMDQKWGLDPVTLGFAIAGNVHPTVAGQQDIANTIGAYV